MRSAKSAVDEGEGRVLADELDNYRFSLRSARLDDRQAFARAIVEAQRLLGMSQAEIAREFRCTAGTASRWSKGLAAPYPGMRKVIFRRLGEKATHRLRQLGNANGNAVAEGCLVAAGGGR
jgi:ribosome-binding protein aMBF1 (putative translation factor)